MSAYLVFTRYWYLCTPVYRLNGRTAFGRECVKQRDRHGYLFLLLCVIFTTFPTLHCLATTERQPAKTAHRPSTIHTLTSMDWASTYRISPSSSCVNPTRAVRLSPKYSTSAVSTSQPEARTSMTCFNPLSVNIAKSASIIASAVKRSVCAAPSISCHAIRMQPCFRLGYPTDLLTRRVPDSRLRPAIRWGVRGLSYPYPDHD